MDSGSTKNSAEAPKAQESRVKMKVTTKDLVGPPRDTYFVIYLQFQAYYQVLYVHPALRADEVRGRFAA